MMDWRWAIRWTSNLAGNTLAIFERGALRGRRGQERINEKMARELIRESVFEETLDLNKGVFQKQTEEIDEIREQMKENDECTRRGLEGRGQQNGENAGELDLREVLKKQTEEISELRKQLTDIKDMVMQLVERQNSSSLCSEV